MFSSVVVFALVLVLSVVTGKSATTKKPNDSSSSSMDSKSDANICSMVLTAVLQATRWSYNADDNTLQRVNYLTSAGPVPTCKCPATDGLGNVSKIVVGGIASSVMCTGCSGNETIVRDIKFCSNSLVKEFAGRSCIGPFGSCSGIAVYRCVCAALTPKTFIPSTTTTTYN